MVIKCSVKTEYEKMNTIKIISIPKNKFDNNN